MPYAHATGATIHYLTAPARPTCPPGTPCVVFIHGGGGSAYVWLHQLPFFAASGFYAVALSVRGWGQSRLEVEDAELFSSGYLAEDVLLRARRVGARRAALVGHSIGGFWCARMLAEWPDRVTHCVFSNTFYGLVDDSDVSKFGERWISRYVDRGAGPADAVKGPGRDDIADAVKDALKPPDSLRVSRTQAQGRSRYPTPPDNFSERFRAERPEMFAGPLLFTATECDSSVHWELVALVARQCAGDTTFHVWRGDLRHAPYIEDAKQFNYGVLAFLQDRPIAYCPSRDDGAPDLLKVVRDNIEVQARTLGRIQANLEDPKSPPTYPQYKIVNFDRLDYCACIENLNEVAKLPNYKFVKGDICSADLVNFVLETEEVDTIMHFAAQTHVDNSFGNSFQFTRNNIMGTHVLLEAAKVHSIKRFVHVSTDEVYGEGENMETEPMIEDHVLEPTNPYAATKAAAEFLVKSYHRSFQLPIIITRGNNVYGPHQFPEKLIPKFVNQLARGRPVTLHGTGANTRNFLYVEDVARAFDCILHKAAVGKIYNIGGCNERSNLSVAKELIRIMGLSDNESSLITFVPDRAFNDLRYTIDNSELAKLGWKELMSWEEGLATTVEWYRKYSNRYKDIERALVAHPRIESAVSAI
ncbi:dTDP-glucose 4,6-dehydratase [Aureococcus anophagefferens]|nr:dTDP-glucose 4,6-dehydratase [Aureococcus anophagefferens]